MTDPQYLTITQAADRLGLSYRGVMYHIQQGHIERQYPFGAMKPLLLVADVEALRERMVKPNVTEVSDD